MVAALGVLAQGETNADLIESMDPWMATDLNDILTKNCVISLFWCHRFNRLLIFRIDFLFS